MTLGTNVLTSRKIFAISASPSQCLLDQIDKFQGFVKHISRHNSANSAGINIDSLIVFYEIPVIFHKMLPVLQSSGLFQEEFLPL